MNEVAFIHKREADWRRLTFLTDKADSSPSALASEELIEFVRLYRKASGDLAMLRTRSTNLPLVDFLNDLVGRAYGTLYRPRRKKIGEAIADNLVLAARTVRKRKWFVAASASLFLLGLFVSYFSLDFYPKTRESLVGDSMQMLVRQWSQPFEEREGDTAFGMTGFYSGHNSTVSIVQGATGAATFGLYSARLLWANGEEIGTLLHELGPYHMQGHLLVSVLPHGVTEVSGLVMSGAAGFTMGVALIAPGRRRRGDALKEASKDGFVLLSISIVMMFIAAPIEGFFSFNPMIPDWLRILFASMAATGWAILWIYCGREQTPSTQLS